MSSTSTNEIIKGYLWYKFKFDLDKNRLEIYDSNWNLVKKINLDGYENLEKILNENKEDMISLFENILENFGMKNKI